MIVDLAGGEPAWLRRRGEQCGQHVGTVPGRCRAALLDDVVDQPVDRCPGGFSASAGLPGAPGPATAGAQLGGAGPAAGAAACGGEVGERGLQAGTDARGLRR